MKYITLKTKEEKMKRAILAIRNTLILEAVMNSLKESGFLVEKASSQETDKILAIMNALLADFLIMDVTRCGDGTFDQRMETVLAAKKQNPSVKIALLCDNVSNEESAYRIKQAKEEGKIDAFFYESVPSNYLVDVIDSL